MHESVFLVVLPWLVLLVAALAVHAIRAPTIVVRALTLEVLAVVLIGVVALVALRHDRPGYLDVAIVLALLGFAQALATARLLERGFKSGG